MKTESELGKNVTGIGMSPIDGKRLVEYAKEAPVPSGDELALLEARKAWAKHAEPVGSVPPPLSLKGMGKQVLQAMAGKNPAVFMDCVGERLGFERTGVRLYEALIAKRVANGRVRGGPGRAELERMRDEELSHFGLLKGAVEKLGGDPTVVTPSADVAGVEAIGLLQVLTDPRTTFEQALHAILIAELTDNDGWRSLIRLTEELGQKPLVSRFQEAQEQEDRHLADVRRWCAQMKAVSFGAEHTAHA